MTQNVPFAREPLHAAEALSAQQGWPHTVAEWQQMPELRQGLVAMHNGNVVGTTLWFTQDRFVPAARDFFAAEKRFCDAGQPRMSRTPATLGTALKEIMWCCLIRRLADDQTLALR